MGGHLWISSFPLQVPDVITVFWTCWWLHSARDKETCNTGDLHGEFLILGFIKMFVFLYVFVHVLGYTHTICMNTHIHNSQQCLVSSFLLLNFLNFIFWLYHVWSISSVNMYHILSVVMEGIFSFSNLIFLCMGFICILSMRQIGWVYIECDARFASCLKPRKNEELFQLLPGSFRQLVWLFTWNSMRIIWYF